MADYWALVLHERAYYTCAASACMMNIIYLCVCSSSSRRNTDKQVHITGDATLSNAIFNSVPTQKHHVEEEIDAIFA